MKGGGRDCAQPATSSPKHVSRRDLEASAPGSYAYCFDVVISTWPEWRSGRPCATLDLDPISVVYRDRDGTVSHMPGS